MSTMLENAHAILDEVARMRGMHGYTLSRALVADDAIIWLGTSLHVIEDAALRIAALAAEGGHDA